MSVLSADAVGGVPVADPNAPGAVPSDQAYADAGAEVHPPDAAPDADASAPSGTPGDTVPNVAHEVGDEFDVAKWKASLPPDQQKNVDRVITDLRQKDAERLRSLEEKTQRLQWAEQLNALASSENPADRARAHALLKATLTTLEQFAPPPEADPLSGIDFDSVEALAPGLGRLVQQQAQMIRNLEGRLGEVATRANEIDLARASDWIGGELSKLEAQTKEAGLPYEESAVLRTFQRFHLANPKSNITPEEAYYATYGKQIFERGKQAALKSLQTKQRAALPGAAPSAAVGSRPKATNMMEAFIQAQRDIEEGRGYKG